MISEEQSFVAHNLSGASATEHHYSVFHAAVVDRIDVISSNSHAHFLHLPLIIHKKGRNPHSLVSTNVNEEND